MSTRTCPVPGCRLKVLPFGRGMCLKHWTLVPAELKREVWDLWRAAPRSERYRAARQQALDAVSGWYAAKAGRQA